MSLYGKEILSPGELPGRPGDPFAEFKEQENPAVSTSDTAGKQGGDAENQLRQIAQERPRTGPPVTLGEVSKSQSDALTRLGVPIPRGTPHEAQVEAIRHVLNRHPELTPDDIAKLPGVVRNPDWIGATDKKGYKRIWLLKQNGNDQLYLAVYGENNGRLRLKTYYTGEQGTILAELKNKGVPLATVANPAVHPVREPGMPSPGLLASEGMPNKNVTIPPQPSSVKQNPTEATPSIATGNRGTFDQANPDIRYSIAANAGPLNIPQRQPQPVVKPKAADNVQAGERFAGKAWPMILEVNHDPDYPFLLLSQGLDLLALVD